MDDVDSSCCVNEPTPRQPLAHGLPALGPGRNEQAGPSLARDIEEASAGNGRAQSSIPTFMGRRK